MRGKVIMQVAILSFSLASCGNTVVMVQGCVRDSATGLPIAKALVSDASYGQGGSCVTDAYGVYSYSTYCEEHTIEISADGYEPLKTTLITPFFPTNDPIDVDVTLAKK